MRNNVLWHGTHHRLQLWVHQNVAIVGDHKGVTINSDLKASNYIEYCRRVLTAGGFYLVRLCLLLK
jgi:hypothetical protein